MDATSKTYSNFRLALLQSVLVCVSQDHDSDIDYKEEEEHLLPEAEETTQDKSSNNKINEGNHIYRKGSDSSCNSEDAIDKSQLLEEPKRYVEETNSSNQPSDPDGHTEFNNVKSGDNGTVEADNSSGSTAGQEQVDLSTKICISADEMGSSKNKIGDASSVSTVIACHDASHLKSSSGTDPKQEDKESVLVESEILKKSENNVTEDAGKQCDPPESSVLNNNMYENKYNNGNKKLEITIKSAKPDVIPIIKSESYSFIVNELNKGNTNLEDSHVWMRSEAQDETEGTSQHQSDQDDAPEIPQLNSAVQLLSYKTGVFFSEPKTTTGSSKTVSSKSGLAKNATRNARTTISRARTITGLSTSAFDKNMSNVISELSNQFNSDSPKVKLENYNNAINKKLNSKAINSYERECEKIPETFRRLFSPLKEEPKVTEQNSDSTENQELTDDEDQNINIDEENLILSNYEKQNLTDRDFIETQVTDWEVLEPKSNMPTMEIHSESAKDDAALHLFLGFVIFLLVILMSDPWSCNLLAIGLAIYMCKYESRFFIILFLCFLSITID